MKKLSTLLCCAIMVFFYGCQQDESPDQLIAGEWVLVEIGSTWTNEVMEAEAINYEENYVFQKNGTFVKTRAGGGSDGQATDTFTFIEAEPNEQDVSRYLLLTLETGTGLVISCYPSEGIEEFVLFKNGRLRNNAGSCDNAVLTYRKKN